MTGLHDPRGIWVKVDGVTRPQDVRAAVDAGVSAVGMVFAPSPRRVTAAEAAVLRPEIPATCLAFGVFADAPEAGLVEELSLGGVQLPASCDYDGPDGVLVLRTVRVRDAADLAVLRPVAHLDAYVAGALGGTGTLARWDVIEAHRPTMPFVLSGGLTPENVADAVRRLRPSGVDVSSGVESTPGVKDHAKLRGFVRAARSAYSRRDPTSRS